MTTAEPKPKDLPAEYTKTRQEWNLCWADAIAQKNNWKLMALLSMGTAVLALVAVVVLAMTGRFRVWIVNTDPSSGRVLSSGMASESSTVPNSVKEALLREWLAMFRSVTNDTPKQRAAIIQIYYFMRDPSRASKIVSEYLREGWVGPSGKPADVMERSRFETVDIDIRYLMADPTAPDTFTADWVETTRTVPDASISKVSHWHGAISVRIDPPKKAEDAQKNPLGVFVTDINFQQVPEVMQ